jgi:uncharacterized protein (DUF169 family)
VCVGRSACIRAAGQPNREHRTVARLARHGHDRDLSWLAVGEIVPSPLLWNAKKGNIAATGAVAASCVFWIEGTRGIFATKAEDHGNCSVGSLTHGFKTVNEIARNSDVIALCETGWVTPEALGRIAAVREKPANVIYGPLRDMPVEPSVILLRLNGKQQMLLHDAWPALRFEGKPQCHIVPIAKEHEEIAVSVGCMLSRVRTGMSNNEVTCAIPASRLPALIERLRAARGANNEVAAYAAEDSKRFARQH